MEVKSSSETSALIYQTTIRRKISYDTNIQWRTEGVGVFKQPPPSKFRSFDKVKPDCKLSGKCLVFLFQQTN